jgi:hypothetical protein
MIHAAGDWGAWEIDEDNSRLRWLGLHEGVEAVMPPALRRFINADGVPYCQADHDGEDGWATYHQILLCEVGAPFRVRWPDGSVMHIPTRLTVVESI